MPNWQHESTVYELAYEKETTANYFETQVITWVAQPLLAYSM